MQLQHKKIYDPTSNESVNDRKIFGGNPTAMFELTRIKYEWAYKLWKTMLNNTWFPEEVNMNEDKRHYLDLQPEEKIGYDRALAQLIFMDSLQTNNLNDNINPFITSPEINLLLIRQAFEESVHCLIDGTEVLTDKGFVNFNDLTYEHKVANYHENREITFSHPKDIIKSKYKGKMYDFRMTNYHQVVTPNHRVVKRTPCYDCRVKKEEQDKIRIEYAENACVNSYFLPVAGKNIGSVTKLSLLERLAIAWQADGSLVNNKKEATQNGYCYQFSFKRYDKISRMQEIISSMKDIGEESGLLKYTRTDKSDGYTHFYIWVTMQFDKEFDWVTLEDKHERYLLDFIDELKYWDGSIRDKAILYTNSNKKAVDKVIAIATLARSQTGVYHIDPKKSKGYNKVEAWQVHIVLGKDHKTGREIKKTSFDYDGYIHCCEVDTGMIICRYDNSIFVTGNSQSYAVMVESISANTDEIYDMWRKDMQLRNKNDYIAHIYTGLADNPTEHNFVKALYANQILEGIYFYSGFCFFYALARQGRMLSSAQMIRFIQRDEVTHLLIFQHLINTLRKERPDIFTKALEEEVVEMFKQAVQVEINWGIYITQGKLMGLTEELIKGYIQYLAKERMERVGLPKIYDNKNPIDWVNRFSSFNEQKTNFFEAKVTNYTKGGVDFDDF